MKVVFALALFAICFAGIYSARVKAAPEGGVDCLICEYVVKFVEGYIEQNETLAQIESDVETLCNLIPGYRSDCNSFVKTYVPELVALLVNKENPNEACNQVGACASNGKPRKF
eukprot:TRINITY_DN12841_c0_g1_i1.p1 TRINITY_DN12841_c0_g1~~TRINITY_DN12841_c0_g1_i1.p1  ORF type:complete len:125 (+),score=25.02 TRINITY_DN12841_c0_g1_i1:35-376(+)